MSKALAIKYRPTTFEDLTEQGAVVKILENQISTNTIKHGYLFCGGAGTGKTTSARIFANMINEGVGEPIELDAASNNSVEDMRRLCEEAQKKSMSGEYKVFIIDECHSLSNQAWQVTLKTLEEPPAKSIFIFCTTNPEKIPATILSRVQRYNFQRISQEGIVNRLKTILDFENKDIMEEYGDMDSASDIDWAREQHLPIFEYDLEAVEYIAKIADGGMRDAITLMDKCLSYSKDLTVNNVIEALGIVDYGQMFDLTAGLHNNEPRTVIEIIDSIYNSGLDLKQFIKNYFEFLLDVNTYCIMTSTDSIKIPQSWEANLKTMVADREYYLALMEKLCELQSAIKWEQNPKPVIIANLLVFMKE